MRSQPFISTVVGPIGDLIAISLPAGQAGAIVIDNPSGSWLTVFPIHDFVPPYTLQWSRDFPSTVASATVRYTDGPSGQISTLQGDPIVAWLDSDPVGASAGIQTPGVSFIAGFTPTLFAVNTDIIATIAGKSENIVAGIPDKRIRIVNISATLNFRGGPGLPVASPVEYSVSPTGPGPTQHGILTLDNPSRTNDYASGLDFPVGMGIRTTIHAAYADTSCLVEVSYQLI